MDTSNDPTSPELDQRSPDSWKLLFQKRQWTKCKNELCSLIDQTPPPSNQEWLSSGKVQDS